MTLEEKRRNKYPDTDTFHYYNANPKKKVTTDCMIRALCTVLEKPYNEVVMDLAKIQCETGYDPSESKTCDLYMKQNGWIRLKQPKKYDGTKYTGSEFCRRLMHPIYSEELWEDMSFNIDRVLANIGGHHIVAIVSGQVYDTWNSTHGSIGQVWVKP